MMRERVYHNPIRLVNALFPTPTVLNLKIHKRSGRWDSANKVQRNQEAFPWDRRFLLDRRRRTAQGFPKLRIEHILSAWESDDFELHGRRRDGLRTAAGSGRVSPLDELGA